jgi:methionyl-tRNA synthetase
VNLLYVFEISHRNTHSFKSSTQKVEQSAEKKGMAPQDFADDVSQNFRDLLELLNISNDKFIRTTEDDHKSAVKVSESM